MLKRMKEKWNNDGNTFIVIMVSLACMSILIAVILASVGYYYRMCRMDLDDKNNFYYLEKAIDEVYSGVGKDSMKHLMTAYTDTMEVMVQYDNGKYTKISEAEANRIMKQKFLYLLANDDNYKVQANLYDNLNSFITTPGVELMQNDTSVTGQPRLYMEIVTTTENGKSIYDKIILHNVTVKREINNYIQSITTDIVISEPNFNVAFSDASGLNNALLEFSMVADRGVEFNVPAGADPTADRLITISGNVYAASDNYNKFYSNAGVISSHASDSAYDGVSDSSKYSGIYNNGSDVTISADKVIVPGTISVINDGNLSIYGMTMDDDGNKFADLWADNIVMAASSNRRAGQRYTGGSLEIWANSHVADDMEINSDNATVKMNGNYYGYNYSATTDESKRALSYYLTEGDTTGDTANAKPHFGSSAIIVNGNNANILFSLDDLYVAGRAYIETTRQKNAEVVTDDSGTYTRTYYTEAPKDNQDIQTGESITVKSNQIAYIPVEVDKDMVPIFTTTSIANDKIVEKLQQWVKTSATPGRQYDYVVANIISGHTYYFLNFKGPDESAAFIDWYVNDLPNEAYASVATDLVNLSGYADFKVAGIDVGSQTKVTTSGAYTTGALNVANSRQLTVTNRSSSVNADNLLGESNSNAATIANFNQISKQYNTLYSQMQYALEPVDPSKYESDSDDYKKATEILDAISKSGVIEGEDGESHYNNLTPIDCYLDMSQLPASSVNEKVLLNDAYDEYTAPQVWLAKGDLTISGDGELSGLIITTGNVTFGSKVTKFNGLIITGSKVIVDHKMSFTSDRQLVKDMLEYAEDHPDECKKWNLDKIFRDLVKDDGDKDDTEGGTSVDRIELGDIIQYENWKKNVED